VARAELLYPERKRCRKCRRFFSFTPPIDLLYCSWECAERDAPVGPDPEVVPRECRKRDAGLDGNWKSWAWKARFETRQEALNCLGNGSGMDVYPCNYCGFWHIGHSRNRVSKAKPLDFSIPSEVALGRFLSRMERGLPPHPRGTRWEKRSG
jgi:hypothetical protein